MNIQGGSGVPPRGPTKTLPPNGSVLQLGAKWGGGTLLYGPKLLRLTLSLLAAALLAFGSAACGDESGCSKDYDCPSTQVCNPTTGECEPFQCAVDDDCDSPSATCKNNVCTSG